MEEINAIQEKKGKVKNTKSNYRQRKNTKKMQEELKQAIKDER